MKKILSFFLLFAALFLLASCNKLHATACDVAVDIYKTSDGTVVTKHDPIVLTESFRSETAVRIGNTLPEDGDLDALPETRTILIDDQDEFDAAFENCPFEVDLSTEMIVVYTFSFIYSRPTVIKKVSFSDGTLSLKLENKRAKWGVKDACMPYQRYVIVKLDKLDVTEVKVTYTVK